MERVYLDTQQYGNLSDSRSELSLDLLGAAVAERRIEIVGSLEVLQEIMALADRRRDVYGRQVALFEELAGNRILEPTNRRHILEHHAGGLLPAGSASLSRASRRSILHGAKRQGAVADVAADAKLQKEQYAATETAARVHIREQLAANDETLTLETARRWFASLDIDEWNREVVEAGVLRGEYEAKPGCATGIKEYPTSWVFTAYRLSRLVFTLGEGQKIVESDLSDSHHAACGVYCDTLVTDDKRFIATLGQIGPDLPFRWMRSVDFARDLRARL